MKTSLDKYMNYEKRSPSSKRTGLTKESKDIFFRSTNVTDKDYKIMEFGTGNFAGLYVRLASQTVLLQLELSSIAECSAEEEEGVKRKRVQHIAHLHQKSHRCGCENIVRSFELYIYTNLWWYFDDTIEWSDPSNALITRPDGKQLDQRTL